MAASPGSARLYKTLCTVLDGLRAEAPTTDPTYHPRPGNTDAIIQARSKALLHLFLKARFGLLTFSDREKLVTDGPNDGGVDAYYIDQKKKIIYVIQSKFRANAGNIVAANMSVADLLKMDVERILKGEKRSESGNVYNNQISRFQSAIRKLADAANYKHLVVLLGNIKDLSQAQAKRLVGDYPIDQVSHERLYSELLFPLLTGTYYSDPNLTIELNLDNVRGDPHLNYDAQTSSEKTNIKLIFVPTREVGRVLSTYRNSILKFNPRSFLELNSNQVNREIEASIRTRRTNEFALFNNGITIIADNTEISSNTARRGAAQLILINPQLVNGAQTAYTLSRIYDECVRAGNFDPFRGKEVLLKLITFVRAPRPGDERTKLVGAISKASNSQTKVDEYDRRSNDPVQRELQDELFAKHGLYYERKRGEFSDGVRNGYISADLMVNRERLVRVSLACDFKTNQARASIAKFAEEAALAARLKSRDAAKYIYGYEVLRELEKARKKRPKVKDDRYHTTEFGQALRYGQYAVVTVCTNNARNCRLSELDALHATLLQWTAFEAWAIKQRSNANYRNKDGSFDFVNYYKGGTINQDLQAYAFSYRN